MSELDVPDGAEPSRRANNGKVWIGAAVGAAIIIAAVAWAFSGGTPDSTGQSACDWIDGPSRTIDEHAGQQHHDRRASSGVTDPLRAVDADRVFQKSLALPTGIEPVFQP